MGRRNGAKDLFSDLFASNCFIGHQKMTAANLRNPQDSSVWLELCEHAAADMDFLRAMHQLSALWPRCETFREKVEEKMLQALVEEFSTLHVSNVYPESMQALLGRLQCIDGWQSRVSTVEKLLKHIAQYQLLLEAYLVICAMEFFSLAAKFFIRSSFHLSLNWHFGLQLVPMALPSGAHGGPSGTSRSAAVAAAHLEGARCSASADAPTEGRANVDKDRAVVSGFKKDIRGMPPSEVCLIFFKWVFSFRSIGVCLFGCKMYSR